MAPLRRGRNEGAVDSFEELRRIFDESPYARLLGMRVEDLSEGYARVSMAMQSAYLNFAGRAHGGLVASLADQAFACATNTLPRTYFAVQLNLNFIAAPSETCTLVAEARVVHPGRSIAVCEMTVREEEDRLIARATGTVAAMERKV